MLPSNISDTVFLKVGRLVDSLWSWTESDMDEVFPSSDYLTGLSHV